MSLSVALVGHALAPPVHVVLHLVLLFMSFMCLRASLLVLFLLRLLWKQRQMVRRVQLPLRRWWPVALRFLDHRRRWLMSRTPDLSAGDDGARDDADEERQEDERNPDGDRPGNHVQHPPVLFCELLYDAMNLDGNIWHFCLRLSFCVHKGHLQQERKREEGRKREKQTEMQAERQ